MKRKFILIAFMIAIVPILLNACELLPDISETSEESHEKDYDTVQTNEVETAYHPYLAITAEEWAWLNEYYSDQDITAVKVYDYGAVSSESLSELLEKDINSALCYVIWGSTEDVVTKLHVYDGDVCPSHHGYSVENSSFGDFTLVNSLIDILDTQCYLYEVICLDGSWMHMGTVNYLITDQGVFVKYYSSPIAEALIFTEDEYRSLAAAYENFCREDLESERDPMLDGPLYSIQFHDFIKDEALLEKYSKP